jgi:uncharacterized protein (DUF1697 family)
MENRFRAAAGSRGAVKYVALIRGINVGGNSIIPMAKLRAAFEEYGVKNVSTFIASGNVLFEAPRTPNPEARLSKVLGLPIRLTCVRTAKWKRS